MSSYPQPSTGGGGPGLGGPTTRLSGGPGPGGPATRRSDGPGPGGPSDPAVWWPGNPAVRGPRGLGAREGLAWWIPWHIMNKKLFKKSVMTNTYLYISRCGEGWGTRKPTMYQAGYMEEYRQPTDMNSYDVGFRYDSVFKETLLFLYNCWN